MKTTEEPEIPKLGSTRASSKGNRTEPHEPMAHPQHESYCVLRAKGFPVAHCARELNLNVDTCYKRWESDKAPVGRMIAARVGWLRMAAAKTSLPGIGVLLHRQYQLFEAAAAAGDYSAAQRILRDLKDDVARNREAPGMFVESEATEEDDAELLTSGG